MLLFVSGGCGDPLVEGDYPGEVLASLEGSVFTDGLQRGSEDDLRVALFWATDRGRAGTEQHVGTSTSFPAQYRLDVYQPPPEEARFEPRWANALVAVATPLLYVDRDHSGRFEPDSDKIIGGSPDIALVWSDRRSARRPAGPRPGGRFVQLRGGFQRMWSDQPLCQDVVDRGELPPDDMPVDLTVGPFWSWLIDLDCDGSRSEWDG